MQCNNIILVDEPDIVLHILCRHDESKQKLKKQLILVIKLTITLRNMILNFLSIIINKTPSVLWT